MIDLTPVVSVLQGKPVAVLGLGVSGMASVRALVAAGIHVRAWDDDATRRDQAGILGAVVDNLSVTGDCAFLVLAPGIPLHYPKPHPVVERARAAGIDIIGDMDLFHRAVPGLKTIGITGTNGKSTATALLSHILEHAGIRVVTGGNIGTAVLDLDVTDKDIAVLELSSYQLDLCRDFSPDIAIHMNLTPDHIDRHGSLQGYIDAKMRIFRGTGDAVIGVDDKDSIAMRQRVQAAGERQVHSFSVTCPLGEGVYIRDGVLHDVLSGADDAIDTLMGIGTLTGVHNHQNAAAAYLAARLMKVKPATIMAAMKTYPGLPHRMSTVRTINGVRYINDSKATNADAAARALACYRNIYWILGGRPKDGGLDGLDPLMNRICHAFVIGEAVEDFAAWCDNRGVPVTRAHTLENAVRHAHLQAQENRSQPGGAGVVLLSPACASFDQFRSFEHRGDVFTDLVHHLHAGVEAAAE